MRAGRAWERGYSYRPAVLHGDLIHQLLVSKSYIRIAFGSLVLLFECFVDKWLDGLRFCLSYVDQTREDVSSQRSPSPACSLETEEQKNSTRNVVIHEQSIQATHSLLTASFPCRVNCMLLEVNTLITSCPSIRAHKHTYTLLSVLIHILVTPLADSNKKRDRRIKSFSLFSKDGMASLPRYVQTCITYSIYVSLTLRTWYHHM